MNHINVRKMEKHISVDRVRVKKLLLLLEEYLTENINDESFVIKLKKEFKEITPVEFALCEQKLFINDDLELTDEKFEESADFIIKSLKGILVSPKMILHKFHPINMYLLEINAVKNVINTLRNMTEKRFVRNEYIDQFDKLAEVKIHFARKQNQLYSLLEKKGFDKPSTLMWNFDNNARDAINSGREFLLKNDEKGFLDHLEFTLKFIEDLFMKENKILYPTSLKMITEEEFEEMKFGDTEIGYCLLSETQIQVPKKKTQNTENNNLENDLLKVLLKHNLTSVSDSKLNVTNGELTLEQINLIYQNIPMDVSFVDENDIMRFYTDSKHRIFPRSKGVIGREVKYCHPKESVETVERILNAFRNKEESVAEFWLQMNGKFIHIRYVALYDDNGTYKGCLETMQEITNLRSLVGNQRLLSWDEKDKEIAK